MAAWMRLHILIFACICYCVNNWIKEANIRTQWQENWRITVILTILASGEKLAHLLIFKAEEGKDTEKITANRVCRKRVFVFWQENTRNRENIMLK